MGATCCEGSGADGAFMNAGLVWRAQTTRLSVLKDAEGALTDDAVTIDEGHALVRRFSPFTAEFTRRPSCVGAPPGWGFALNIALQTAPLLHARRPRTVAI